MQKIKVFIIFMVIILFFGGILFFSFWSKRIPSNPSGTIGNTAGNLINNGLFCESDGKVYFSNPYDQDTIYSMNSDETEIKKISTVGAQSINAAGNFLYYYQKSAGSGSGLGYVMHTVGLYRSKTDGSSVACLKRDPTGIITLINNDLYYQHYTNKTGTYLDRMSTDKSSEETIFTSMISPASVVNGIIYYTNPDDSHYLYTYDTTTGSSSLLWPHRVWNPIYHNDYIYFMDMETDYELHRYNPYTNEEEVLTTDRIDTYNVYGDIIYYQKSSPTEPALMRMRTDGSQPETVASGIYQNINITSGYVYFNAFDQPAPLYHQSTFGPVYVEQFIP